MRVAFIGLGNMGRPMSRNLIKAGHEVAGYDLFPEAVAALKQDGGRAATSALDAAKGAEVVISMLPTSDHVRDLYTGKGELLDHLPAGTLLMDSSTISISVTRELAEAAKKRGCSMIDGPVSGGVMGAEAGTLTFMVGGEAAVLECARPVLEAMGKKIFLLGPNGAGQTIKLAMNAMLALQVNALAESLALVRGAGLAGEKLIEVLQSSMARSGVLDVKAPLMLKGEYPASFPLRLMHKDMRLALELGREEHVKLPALDAAYGTFSNVKDASKDDPDFAAVARFWGEKK